MTVIGFHNSHEQVHPADLLRAVQHAEEVGFTAAMCSDHLEPWNERQGHSGFAWSWLGAALATTNLPFGAVNAPGQRYHPVIIAQAIATLNEMFPRRMWAALGSGEAANERITGEPWPPKADRNARLLECVEVIRALLRGEEVTHHGRVHVERARLWTLPAEQPLLIGPAVSVETAGWGGGWADGLVTVNGPAEHLARVLDAFRANGGAGKRTALQVHVSWARTEQEALDIAHDQWRTLVFGPPLSWDLESVDLFDQAATHVRPDDVRKVVLVSSDLARHTAWLQELAALGFDELYLHHVGQEQAAFIDAFGEHVLPELQGTS